MPDRDATERRLREWMANMERVYSGFHEGRQQALSQGFSTDSGITRGDRMYVVGLTWCDEFTRHVEVLSRKIARVTPSLVYNMAGVHTTLAVRPLVLGEEFGLELSRTQMLVDELVHKSSRDDFAIEFGETLFNRNSVIIAGRPVDTPRYLERSRMLSTTPLKLGWGCHITAARFRGDSGCGQAIEVKTILDEASIPRGPLKPKGIMVFSFTLDNSENFSPTIHSVSKFMS